MWLLAFSIYGGCKWLTWRRTAAGKGRVETCPTAAVWRHVGYLLAWPGLDAAAFLSPRAIPRRPTPAEWFFAFVKLCAGLAVLFVAARRAPADYPYLAGWIGMVGIVMALHFGLFHLLSCAWRSAGVDAKPLMNWPLAASSLADFWGRRWNTAFRDLTHRFLFRPLTPRLGPRGAVFTGFVFSGLVHDLVISVPAGGGYGGPTLFFVIQGAGILAQRSRLGRKFGLETGWRGWLFTMTALVGPAVLLFHDPFVTGVVVPFLHALGAI